MVKQFPTVTPAERRAKNLARLERSAQVSRIVAQYMRYNPDSNDPKGINFKKSLEEVLAYVPPFTPERSRVFNLNDRIANPLDVVELLVTLEQVDRDTIFTAILYPHLIPQGRNSIDREKMLDIKKKFGGRVKTYVEDTISLWSLSRLPTETQQQNLNSRLFTLMALLLSRSRAAVMIRGATTGVNIANLEEVKNRSEQEQVLARSDLIADLCYLAECSKLRTHILNQKLKFTHAELYGDLRRHLGTARVLGPDGKPLKRKLGKAPDSPEEDVRVKVEPHEYLEAIQILMDKFNHTPLEGAVTSEWRPKEAASLLRKMIRKGQTADQIGDNVGVCVVIKQDFIDGKFYRFPERQEKAAERRKRKEKEQVTATAQQPAEKNAGNETFAPISSEHNAVLLAYSAVTKAFGRNSPDPVIKNLIEELMIRDPDLDNLGKDGRPFRDARHDDYYVNEKPSGYRAKQDTAFVVLKNGKIIEMEVQFVGENQDRFNRFGDPNIPEKDPSHVWYKTGITERLHILAVKAWRAVCRATDEEGNRPRVPYSAVYLRDNSIVLVEGSRPGTDKTNPEGGVMAIDFIKANLPLIRETYPEIAALAKSDDELVKIIDGVSLDNDNPTVPRDPESIYGKRERLRSGDRIEGFNGIKPSSLEGGPG